MIIDNKLLENDIIKSFMKKYKIPKELSIKIIITDDMEKEYKHQLNKFNKRYDYISPIDYNGITCVPNSIDEETIILINYDRVKDIKSNNAEVICTIFHELIHAKDYYFYYKNYCNGLYDSSKNRDSQYGFMNWSEFNAKKISYLEYCKLLHSEKLYKDEELENIKRNELPIKNKEIVDILNNEDSDMEYIIYNLMLYLGRYSIWEELFFEEFNNGNKFPEELNMYKPVIDELYKVLKNNAGKIEDYIEIKKLINYFKGAWVNIMQDRG